MDFLKPNLRRYQGRRINIHNQTPATPVIFLVGGIPYKADVSAEPIDGVIQDAELTVREDVLLRMILTSREGSVSLALENAEVIQDLKKAFLDLFYKTLATGPREMARRFTPEELKNIEHWAEHLSFQRDLNSGDPT